MLKPTWFSSANYTGFSDKQTMDDLTHIIDFYKNLDRLGPGGEAETIRAWNMISLVPEAAKLLLPKPARKWLSTTNITTLTDMNFTSQEK